MEYSKLEIALGAWFFLNVIVTICLTLRDDLEKGQVIGQAVIVWLIPFFGALGIWLLNRSHDDSYNRSKISCRDSSTSNIQGDGLGGGSD